MNRLVLDATIQQRDVLRYTPAGLAVTTLWLEHLSEVESEGSKRTLECSLMAKFFGPAAEIAQTLLPHIPYRFEGALVAKRKGSKSLMLEIETWRQLPAQTNT